MIPNIKDMTYEDRLKLVYRRKRGDGMIMMYKIMYGLSRISMNRPCRKFSPRQFFNQSDYVIHATEFKKLKIFSSTLITIHYTSTRIENNKVRPLCD